MAISAASAAQQSSQASSQNKGQLAWNRYNAQMQYKTDITNIASSSALARINAGAASAAGAVNARISLDTSRFNADMIHSTWQYNDKLIEEELSLMWDSIGLDLSLLENQRAVERGGILANQAASGVIMNQDSAQDVIVDQKTQEALDAFIIRHGGDIQASKINNARAQGKWQAEAQVAKTLWEGEMGAYAARANASIQSGAIMAGARVSAFANTLSANYRLESGMAGASMQSSQNQQAIGNNMMQGMFGAASQGVANYYGSQNTSLISSPYTYGTGASGANYQPGPSQGGSLISGV